ECIILAITARDVSRLIYHISQIGRICKELVDLNFSLDDEDTISKMLLKLIEEGYKMVMDVFKALLERDVKLASEIMDRMNEVRKLDEVLTTEIFKGIKDIKIAVKLTALIREIRRTAGHCVALADDTIFNETTRLAYQIKQHGIKM
ncbi:MAG: PhoU domain-containing protein, partial [Candidatus Bathyarchaeota archaeon]|nr:PhoU domain-containing protein [Candidatus Bathyarchaeota archaeon]